MKKFKWIPGIIAIIVIGVAVCACGNEKKDSANLFQRPDQKYSETNKQQEAESPYVIGKHVSVSKAEIESAADFYELSGLDREEAMEKAIAYMEEREALYYAAVKNGFNVTDEEVEAFLEELKEFIDSADNKQDALDIINQFDSEEEYWQMEFEVYKKDLPIMKLRDYLQQEFEKHSGTQSNSDMQQDAEWTTYYDNYKQSLVEGEAFEIVAE